MSTPAMPPHVHTSKAKMLPLHTPLSSHCALLLFCALHSGPVSSLQNVKAMRLPSDRGSCVCVACELRALYATVCYAMLCYAMLCYMYATCTIAKEQHARKMPFSRATCAQDAIFRDNMRARCQSRGLRGLFCSRVRGW